MPTKENPENMKSVHTPPNIALWLNVCWDVPLKTPKWFITLTGTEWITDPRICGS